MTIGEWLDARTPAAPDALRERITTLVHESLTRNADDATAVFLTAAERLLAALLASESSSRDSALDLLTADALVTYAFEAAGDAPAKLVPRVSDAMTRIASLGAAASDRASA